MKKEYTQAIYVIFAAILASVTVSCAKVGTPTGGPQDVTPPLMVTSTPPRSAVNFSEDAVEIGFNEYIQLKNADEEVMISPPLSKRPDILVRNREVIVEFNDTLLPNTTYTINFGNAIADNNEGNLASGFEFVFSTGSTIDSLGLTGSAYSATDRKPPGEDDKVYIMIYDNLEDSAPLLELPRYIGKVNKTGTFSVHNMRSGTFRPVVVLDSDGDRMYDPVSDAIGFTDSLVVVNPETVKPVTLLIDTTRVNDSLITRTETVNSVNISLVYFYEMPSKVFIASRSRETPERLFFTFTRPPYDTVQFNLTGFTPAGKWFVRESSPPGDSVSLWLTDTTLIRSDSLSIEALFTTADSTGSLVMQRDTITFFAKAAALTTGGRRRTEKEQPDAETPAAVISRLSLDANIQGGKVLDLNRDVLFTAGRPVDLINDSLIVLEEIRDSLRTEQNFTIVRDSSAIRKFSLKAAWKPSTVYEITLRPGAVSDIYGAANDTLSARFSTRAVDDYGNIILNLEGGNYPMILQLLDGKGSVVQENYLTQARAVNMNYVLPGTYSLKAIYDLNGNGKWDTGNYFLKIQPEMVFYYGKPYAVRANWDQNLLWQLGDR